MKRDCVRIKFNLLCLLYIHDLHRQKFKNCLLTVSDLACFDSTARKALFMRLNFNFQIGHQFRRSASGSKSKYSNNKEASEQAS